MTSTCRRSDTPRSGELVPHAHTGLGCPRASSPTLFASSRACSLKSDIVTNMPLLPGSPSRIRVPANARTSSTPTTHDCHRLHWTSTCSPPFVRRRSMLPSGPSRRPVSSTFHPSRRKTSPTNHSNSAESSNRRSVVHSTRCRRLAAWTSTANQARIRVPASRGAHDVRRDKPGDWPAEYEWQQRDQARHTGARRQPPQLDRTRASRTRRRIRSIASSSAFIVRLSHRNSGADAVVTYTRDQLTQTFEQGRGPWPSPP